MCQRYRPAVVAYLERRGLGQESEDVAQEVLLALVQALPRVSQGAGRFRSLVYAVASNKLATHLRHRGAQKRGGDVPLVENPDVYPSEREPDDLFDREWLEALVRKCLGRLREAHRDQYEALKKFVLEGRPQAEIAAELGVTASTIRKRVWRGKRAVTAYLREEVETYALSPQDAEAEIRYLSSLIGPLGSDSEAPAT
jgi:RNA polymerase sigma-70 factor (ECF subfamily)